LRFQENFYQKEKPMSRPTQTTLVLALLLMLAAISALAGCAAQMTGGMAGGSTTNFTNGGISDN
jgi:hypothetical protein